MTPEQFCYWLRGRSELLPEQPPSKEEWEVISDHLALVFRKVTSPTSGALIKWPPEKIEDLQPICSPIYRNYKEGEM